MSKQTEHAQAEQACIEFVMKTQSLDREGAARFFNRGLAAGWFNGPDVEPEFKALVLAYKAPVKDHGYSGAARRHVGDVMESGRQAMRERIGKA